MRQPSSLRFLSDDLRFGIEIEHKEVLKILKICRSAGNIEVGGIVIGSYDQAHRYALVKTISDAPLDSLKGGTWFRRGIRGLQELLNQFWFEKRYFYLGEWHYHPNHSAHASSLDIEQMREISMSDNYNCPEPILLICGGDPSGHWEFSAYVVPRDQAEIKLGEVLA